MTSSPFLSALRSAFSLAVMLTALALPCALPAQALEWARNFGNSAAENARAIISDPDGNIYIGGNFAGTVDFDPGAGVSNYTSAGSGDAFIAKYTAAGALLWVDVLGGPFSEETYEIVYGSDDYIYITGYFTGNPDMDPGAGVTTLTGGGGQDVFFAKYRAGDGSLVWARQISSLGNEMGKALDVDASGNVYVGGDFKGTADFNVLGGGFFLTNYGQEDGFVAKYDSTGAFLWAGQLGSTLWDYVHGLVVDTAGAVYVTGSFYSTADMDLMAGVSNKTSLGQEDIFFNKYTTDGNLVWTQAFGGTGRDEGFDVDLSRSTSLVLTGYFQGTVDFNGFAGTYNVSSVIGSQDVIVADYDTAGNVQWAFRVGDGADDQGYAIAVTPAGVVYVTGYIRGTADFDPGVGVANVTASDRDPFVARYDAAGNYSWAFSIFGGLNDYGKDVNFDSAGKVLAMGTFILSSDFDPGAGTTNLTATGSDDVYFAKYIPCQEPAATTSPQATSTCIGGNAGFTFSYTGPADSTRWYSSTDEGATWQLVPNTGIYSGATTTTLSITGAGAAQNSTHYRAVLYSCIRAADTTGAAPLYVIQPDAAFYPLPQDACEDAESVTFTPFQYAIRFDADLDYLQANAATTGNFGTADFTVEGWINTTASGSTQHLFSKGYTAACVNAWDISLTAAGKIKVEMSDAGCVSSVNFTSIASVNTGTWKHIAVTRSGTSVRIYIDGVLDNTATATGVINLSNAFPMVVGSNEAGILAADVSSSFVGRMDEIRVWSEAKTATEIALLRRKPLQGDEDYLSGYWQLNEGPGSSAAEDKTANNVDLVLNGINTSSDWVWNNIHQLTYSWAFGDAGSSTDSISTHVYASPNTYTASLTVTTPGGCADGSSEPVYIVSGPSASWTSTSLDTCVGDTIVFTPDQYALSLDGVDEYASVSPPLTPVSGLAMEAWIHWSGATGTEQVIMYNGAMGANGYGLLISAPGSGSVLTLRVAGFADALSAFTPPVNAWTHVALTYNLSVWTLYVNGLPVSLSGSPGFSAPATSFTVGGNTTPGVYFSGLVDEIRFWSQARTQQQVQAYQYRSLSGTEGNLMAYWNANADKGSSQLTDLSGNGRHLLFTNIEPASDFAWANPLAQTWNWFVNDVSATTDSIYQWAPPVSGVYELKLRTTNTRGCTAADSVNVVGDTVKPDMVCKNITLYLNASGAASILPADINNGSSDACNIDTLWLSRYSFTCADTGVVVVRLAARDHSQLVDSCSANVTVRDTLDPLQSCQDLSIYLDAAGNAVITPAQVNNGSTDNCGIQSLSLDETTFDCSEVGSNTVMLTVRDVSGNTSTCSATITVSDTVKPNALCRNLTVYLDGTGSVSITPAMVNNGSTDACGLSTLMLDNTAFDCGDVGANMVTLTVTDVNLNVRTCTATITVADSLKPNAVCQDLTRYLDATGNVSITAAEVNNSSTDNCGIASLSADVTAFNCSDVGGNPVVLTVTDVNGNSRTCSATVTVIDSVKPIAVCQDVNIWLDSLGAASTTAAAVNNMSSDACGIATLGLSGTSFSCADLGANPVLLTVTDVNGNSRTCSATVNVMDTIDVTAVCRNVTVYLNGAGTASITTAMVDNGSWDNCGVPALSLDDMAFTCADVGANMVTLTAEDIFSNTASCLATITVVDSIKPNAICQNLTRYLDATGNLGVSAAEVNNSSTDNCGIASLSLDVTAFNCTDVGANPVLLTLTDVNGNSRSCAATITVIDSVKPLAVCQDITVWLDSLGAASATAAAVNNASSDACGISSLSLNITSFSCSDLGANPVLLTVTDVNGNSRSCSANVNVQDTIDVIAVCRNLTLSLDAGGNASLTPAMADSASWDNCGAPALSLDITTFDCSDVGPNMVTLTATDMFSNTSTCLATITVQDVLPPTAICQNLTLFLDGTGNVSTSAAAVNNGSSDNCGIASLVLSTTAFTCADAGPNTVTLTVNDVNGNASTCNATLNVLETEAPVAVCKNISVYLDSTGAVSITGPALDNGSTDNCAITSIGLSVSAFDCADTGPNVVQVIMSDASANRDTCFSTVTVLDTIDVNAVCSNLTVYLNGAGTAAIDSSMIEAGSYDNCALVTFALSDAAFNCGDVGANSVTLTVTNQNGDADACTSTVTVLDTTDANALCNNLTVYLSAAGTASITPAMVDNGSTDNCGIATRVLSTSAFTCPDVGSNAVTLTFTDVNGNVSSCLSTITVQDTVSPAALCKPVTLVLDSTGNALLTPAEVNNGISDACGISSLGLSSTAFGCANVGSNAVTLTVTDVNGNNATCLSTVTVNDTLHVFISCRDTVVYLNASGTASLDSSWVTASAWDNCGIVTIGLSQSTFDCSDVDYLFLENPDQSQTTHNTLSAEDRYWQSFVSGLTGDLTRLRILDSSSTVLTLRIYSGAGVSGALLHTQTFSSVAGWANVSVFPPVPFVAGGQYTLEVERITAPAEPVYSTLDPYVSGQANLNGFTGTSNNLDLGFETFITVGTLFPDVPVTVTASDAHGNSSSCIATVAVIDPILPTAVCNNATLYLNASGTATADAAVIGAGSSDNCAVDTLWLSQSVFTCSFIGSNSVTLTVRDTEGNISTCTSTITVMDTLDPVAVCVPYTAYIGAPGTVTITAANVNGGSTDNCGTPTANVSPSTFNCTNLGANSVTLTLTDGGGGTSSCLATVTVLDTTAPVLVDCPLSVFVTADPSDCSPSVSWPSPLFTDNCGFTLTSTHSSGDSFDEGTTFVTYTATDGGGRSTDCVFDVNVDIPLLQVNLNVSSFGLGYEISCNGASDGWIFAEVDGGCMPYTYAWSTGASADSITGLGPGAYSVTITDSRGFTATASVNLNEPAALSSTPVTITNESCPGAADGSIDITLSGGVSPYFMLWSTGASSTDLTGIAAGTYSYTLTDALGCTLSESFAVPGDSLAPVAAFSYDSSSTPTYFFTDLSTGSPTTWAWDFGDGGTDTVQNPFHPYGVGGYHTVTLIVTNNCGSDTVSHTFFMDTLLSALPHMAGPAVSVSPNPTTDLFGVSLTGFSGNEVTLSLTDLQGHILHTQVLSLRKGRTTWQGTLEGLAKGLYILEVKGENGHEFVRLVKM